MRYAPLNTGRTPTIGSPFSVRGVSLGAGLTVTEVKKRKSLLNDLDNTFAGAEQNSQLLEGLDEFSKQAARDDHFTAFSPGL